MKKQIKKHLNIILAVCLAAAGLHTGSVSAGAAVTAVSEGVYSLRNLGTGKYLNVYGNKNSNKTNIDIYARDNTSGQNFRIYKYGSSYALTPQCSSDGKVINVYANKAKSGNNVCLWQRTNDNTQLWKFDKVSSGYVIRCADNTGCALTAAGSGNSSNVNITAYNVQNKNQIWVLESRSTAAAASQLKIAGAAYPGTIKKGTAFSCRGTISSNYTLTSVTGRILAGSGSTVVYSKTVNPGAKSYNLYGSSVDRAMLFNKLGAGTYCYTVTASDSSGKSLTLISGKFSVTAPNTAAKGSSRSLSINTSSISKVGWQKPYTLSCQAYSLAYCRTILDKKVHSYTEYWKNGNGQPALAKYKHTYYASAQKALRKVYDQINAGRPCVIFGNQNGGGQHYVTVYGYTGVTDPDNMTIHNLVIIDSISRGGSHYLSGSSVKKSITSLRKYGNGKYAVLVAK